MNQSTQIDVIAPTGDGQADRHMLDGIRQYLGRQEIVNTIQLAGFLARDGFDPTHP
ncbi:MAG: hypothetical protein H0T72_09805, partial [Chloroflexia bacterium]|nr:hypothetical protein [Chloroflexia bacterium]